MSGFDFTGPTGILSQQEIYSIQYHLVLTTYMSEKDAQSEMNKYGLTLDTELSQKDPTGQNRVWVNSHPGTGLGDAVVSCRGTQSFRNVVTDVFAVFFGFTKNIAPDFINVKAITLAAENKYGVVDAVGHSLGGTLASYSRANGRIVTFNKGAGIFSLFNRTPDNETDYRTDLDVVSVLSYFENHLKGNIITNTSPNVNSIAGEILKGHGMKNFETFLPWVEQQKPDSFQRFLLFQQNIHSNLK